MSYIREVAEAVKARCDGAIALDNMGYNKPDAEFIRGLLAQKTLTPSQTVLLGRHLLKYKRQITEDLRLDYEKLRSEVDKLAKTTKIEPNVNAYVDQGLLYIKTPYDERFTEEIRKLKSRRWDGERKLNTVSDPAEANLALDLVYSLFGVRLNVTLSNMNAFGTTILKADAIVISARYNEFFVHDIKEVKAWWQPDQKTWSVKLFNLDQAIKLEGVLSKYNIITSPEVKEFITSRKAVLGKFAQEKKDLINLSTAVKAPEIKVATPEGLTLFPFQSVGVAFISKVRNALIADEMGLGKTIQVLAYLYNNETTRPVLVVCPNAVKYNWRKEIMKWCPDSSVAVISGRKSNGIGKADFYVINYDILNNHIDELVEQDLKMMVLDESHYVKNYKAKRSKSVIVLSKVIPQVIALTGTPILNRPIELFTTFQCLKVRDSELRDFWIYAKKFCDAHQTQFGWDMTGASNLDELQVKLRSSVMIRRLKKDVLKELPPKQRIQVPVEISNRAEYDEAMHNFEDWYWKTERKELSGNAELLVQMEKLKQLTYKGKLGSIIEFIEDTLEQKTKIVIYAHHIELQEKLFAAFQKYGAVKITGGMSAEDRQATVDAFNNGARVCVCSIKAGGVGINLQSADTAIFCELGWTPSEHRQAEDRLHRIGQAGNVQCYYIVAENTIEQSIADVLMEKQKIIDAAIDGAESGGEGSVIGEVMKRMFE